MNPSPGPGPGDGAGCPGGHLCPVRPDGGGASAVVEHLGRARADGLLLRPLQPRERPVDRGPPRLGVVVTEASRRGGAGQSPADFLRVGFFAAGRRADRRTGAGAEAGQPGLELGSPRCLGLELAEHADRSGGHPVDEQVVRRQVQLQAGAVGGRAGVRPAPPGCAARPGRTGTSRRGPAPGSARGSRAGLRVEADARPHEALPAQAVEHPVGVAGDRQLQQRADRARQTVGSRFTAP